MPAKNKWDKASMIARFESRFTKTKSGCWIWSGSKNKDGYGMFRENEKGAHMAAHRWYYIQKISPIPKKLVCDHQCERKDCVNPSHIKIVTSYENIMRSNSITAINARKTHCIRGHLFDVKNTRFDKYGDRSCKACGLERYRKNYKPKMPKMKRDLQIILQLLTIIKSIK